ncbi:MAG: hypothetical protein IPM36_01225 [Lewinellaceae bacterium]|nr:hypothetical protein [Lewinellaceae bacterium]
MRLVSQYHSKTECQHRQCYRCLSRRWRYAAAEWPGFL